LYFIVLPYLLVYGFGSWNEALGRLIALMAVFAGGPIVFVWIAINPQAKFLGKKSKLNRPEYDHVRPFVIVLIRVLTAALGLVVCWRLSIPLLTEGTSVMLHRESPTTTTKVVAHAKGGGFGWIWFYSRNVAFEDEAETRLHYYMFSFKPLRVGREYEFTILPTTGYILQVRDVVR
jgi:hypothetical protein